MTSRRHLATALVAATCVLPCAACRSSPRSTASAPATGAAAPPAAIAPSPALDSIAAERRRYLAELRQQIAGRDTLPATVVFKNIQTMRRSTAGRLLSVMDIGFGRSLGVSCTHCHIPGEWDKDDKPTKQIARDMSAMVTAINTQQLRNIKNLKSENPIVNCTTCHRGQTKPALDMP